VADKEVEVLPAPRKKKKHGSASDDYLTRNPPSKRGRRPAAYNEVITLKAAEIMLDRAWGKAPAFVQVDGSVPATMEQAKGELMQVISQLRMSGDTRVRGPESSEDINLAEYDAFDKTQTADAHIGKLRARARAQAKMKEHREAKKEK